MAEKSLSKVKTDLKKLPIQKPKRKTVKSTERPTQKKILKYLEDIGAVTIKINNIAIFGKRWGTIRKEQQGCSDIIAGYRGLFIAIEVKSQTGYPRPDQKAFIDKCRASGSIAFWCRNLGEVERAIQVINDIDDGNYNYRVTLLNEKLYDHRRRIRMDL